MTTFQQTHEIIENSAVFKKFKQENQDAELVAGFFILDFLSNDNKDSLDYKLPENKGDKIYTFELDKNKEVIIKEDKLINQEIPNQQKLTKILPNIKTDLNEIPSIAQQEAEKNNITSKFHKIIAVLQNYKPENQSKEQQIWNLTCMLDQLIILNILINAQTSEIIKFERKSMMDFIKKR